ncbi:MAG TPA: hypothetical protein VIT66_13330 [Lysobacter sp.]
MLSRILPARVDNRFRGHVLALWLFVPITLMRIAISLLHIFSADGGAQSVSKLTLDTYPASAAQNVIALMSRLGLEQLLLGLIALVVLLRYRALIPLMYLVIVAHYIAHQAIAGMKPLALAGTSGASTPAIVIAAASGVGLVLSLMGKGYRRRY